MYIETQTEQAIALVEENNLPSANLQTDNDGFFLKKLPYTNEITTIDQIRDTFELLQQQTSSREHQAVLYFTLLGVETRFWVTELAKQGKQQEGLEILTKLRAFEGKIAKIQKQIPKEILWLGSYRYEHQALKLFLQKEAIKQAGNAPKKTASKRVKERLPSDDLSKAKQRMVILMGKIGQAIQLLQATYPQVFQMISHLKLNTMSKTATK